MKIESCEPDETKDGVQKIDESTYLDMCVDYALKTGWVKPEQKDVLVNEYLKPIYQKYLEVIDELKTEVAAESDAKEVHEAIIKRLNYILERTHRIGSTDHNNITRAIYDYRDRFCRSDMYLEYAATSLADFVSELLYSKS